MKKENLFWINFKRRGQFIDHCLAVKLKAMVGFRNIAVHDYQALNVEILQKIIESNLDDFMEFVNLILRLK